LKKLITDRQKLIRIADRSEHGWATVEEYEANDEHTLALLLPYPIIGWIACTGA
jgi:hypothetical protein